MEISRKNVYVAGFMHIFVCKIQDFFQTIISWNELERETRNAPNIATFKRNMFARFFN